MEFEFKNSLDPDNKESTLPELKLLNDGNENPESGASVVAGMDDDEDEEDDGENALRNESGIIEPNPLLLPLLPLLLLLPLLPNRLLPVSLLLLLLLLLLPLPLPLLLLPLNMFILYCYVYFIFYLILVLLIL
jgi:hypothetical protein